MRVSIWMGGLSGLAVACALFSPALAAAASCDDVLPPTKVERVRRALDPVDLVRLRDIGPNDTSFPDARLFTLSPDRRRLAFQIRRADPQANAYCLAMVVMDARPGAVPLIIDQGGELIRSTIDLRGKAGFPSGIPLTITPRWSPDGRWIAFLKRLGGTTQIWRADPAGGGSTPLTRTAFDVEDFQIASGGKAIVFTGRPALGLAKRDIAREGLTGFHFDDRYAPVSSNRPFPAMPIATETYTLDLATGKVRAASSDEIQQFRRPAGAPAEALAFAQSATGARAWIRSASDDVLHLSQQLVVETPGGGQLVCASPACEGRLGRLWWRGDAILYSKTEGPGSGTTNIYEWRPGRAAPRRIYATQDVLADCEPVSDKLMCVREGSTTPRHISVLDPVSGQDELIFEPNPEFRNLEMGAVQRFAWRNSFGLETIGDLVLPVGYKAGNRYPLIVVQYDTRGFLRGGTGDEFPIQAFANRGFAVLSFSSPPAIGLQGGKKDVLAIGKANLDGFANRRNIQSSLEVAVRRLIARGIVDPKRVGITGLSDGGSTAEFALLHSSLFAAAAMSSCCWDVSLPMRVGPNAARYFREQGYPGLTEDGTAFWSQISLAANARKIKAPILLQMADDEYMSSLMGYMALREVGAPVDLFIFPGEHHVKWQPAHRLAVFRRSLDWFDFWLKGVPPVGRSSEVAHWEELKRDRSDLLSAQR